MYRRAGVCFFLLCFLLSFSSFLIQAADPVIDPNPRSTELSMEGKRLAQQQILSRLITKYTQNQTFVKVQEYMVEKYHELRKPYSPRFPALLLKETFEKSQNVYEKTQRFVGNSFKSTVSPEQLEKSIDKFLWLKGLCFFILGIKEEHKIGLSYFYQPGNESLRRDLIRDIVQYYYPGVPDLPENQLWFQKMDAVMDRLGSKLFDVQKYCSSTKYLSAGY